MMLDEIKRMITELRSHNAKLANSDISNHKSILEANESILINIYSKLSKEYIDHLKEHEKNAMQPLCKELQLVLEENINLLNNIQDKIMQRVETIKSFLTEEEHYTYGPQNTYMAHSSLMKNIV